jgi:dipeptidyl aminopeptidase/acylaminoacyl peptidase
VAEFNEDSVPCELIVIEGAGHGFAGQDGERAVSALVAWFDKYLAGPTNAINTSAKSAEATGKP